MHLVRGGREELELLAAQGYPAELLEKWTSIPIEARTLSPTLPETAR